MQMRAKRKESRSSFKHTSFSELHANLEIEIQNLRRDVRLHIDVGKRARKSKSIKSGNLRELRTLSSFKFTCDNENRSLNN
jgi:hypothetical protein